MSCLGRESNPHDPFGSRDFKSLVSTDSTIRATSVAMPHRKNVRQRALSGAKLMINYVFCKFSAIFTIFFAIERVQVVIALLIALLFHEHRSLGALHTPALRARRDRYRIGPRLRACISTYKATMGTAHDRSRRCFRSHNS